MNANKLIEISHKGPFSQSASAPLYFSVTTRNIATPATQINQNNANKTYNQSAPKALSKKN